MVMYCEWWSIFLTSLTESLPYLYALQTIELGVNLRRTELIDPSAVGI